MAIWQKEISNWKWRMSLIQYRQCVLCFCSGASVFLIEQSRIYLSLTHWGWVTHICVGKLTMISSDNGLSPDRRQAIILTNAGILLIGPLGTNFSEILIEIFIQENVFESVVCESAAILSRPQCVNNMAHTGQKILQTPWYVHVVLKLYNLLTTSKTDSILLYIQSGWIK